ncbi:MAG: CHC2 zinc finger domain-containing protein, partial [Cytophagaceae bacterium]
MEIKDIKAQLTLAQVIKHYGFKADKQNRINCPFHNDKTPSMQLYWKTHTAYCFSSNCSTHGKSLDVIDFIMNMEKINKHEAILKAEALINPKEQITNPKELARTAVLQRMFIYFKNAVHNSKPARDYIEQRGLDFTRLEIGYNTGQFHHGTRRDEALIKSCVEVGLLSPFGVNNRKPEEQAYKPFAKYALVFALKNRAGQVTGMYFRSTVNEDNQKHYYLKESTGLYPKYPDSNTERLIIAESVIDTATLLQIEIINKEYTLLAAYGTNRLSPEHIEAIRELKNLKEIIFAFDNDEPGNKAVEKYASQLKELLPEVTLSKMNLPEGEDVNSTGLSHQPEIFLHLLENRTFLLSNEKEKSESASPNSETNIPQLNTKNPFKISYKTDTANYYIQGGVSKVLDSMKVTLVIEHPETLYKTRNKLDLYEDKQVERLCKEVGEKLNLRKDILEADIYKLTDLLDEFRERELLNSNNQNEEAQDLIIPLTVQERQQIESFGKKENLIQNLNNFLGKAGIVGEEKNRIFLLIIAASYKMPETLHALIQGSSGSGKTRLLKQISDCIPKEKVTKLT